MPRGATARRNALLYERRRIHRPAGTGHGHELLARGHGVGHDHHGRVERDDALDAALLVFRAGVGEVRRLVAPDDLHPVGVDVVQVTHEVGRRLGGLHRRLVEAPLGVGVTRHPFPAQGRPVFFKQRFGADDSQVFEAHDMRVRPPNAAAARFR